MIYCIFLKFAREEVDSIPESEKGKKGASAESLQKGSVQRSDSTGPTYIPQRNNESLSFISTNFVISENVYFVLTILRHILKSLRQVMHGNQY